MTHLLGFDLVSDFFRDEGSNKLMKSRSLRGSMRSCMLSVEIGSVAILRFCNLNLLIGSVLLSWRLEILSEYISATTLTHQICDSNARPWRKSGPLQAWDTWCGRMPTCACSITRPNCSIKQFFTQIVASQISHVQGLLIFSPVKQRWIDLLWKDPSLFYRTILAEPSFLMPIVYTPTVGEASVYRKRRPDGRNVYIHIYMILYDICISICIIYIYTYEYHVFWKVYGAWKGWIKCKIMCIALY